MVWGTGRPLREFVHVDDLADALVFLARHYSEEGPINVGSGEEISIADLAALIAEVVGWQGRFVLDRSVAPPRRPRLAPAHRPPRRPCRHLRMVLMTRGLAEMTRLAVALGARTETLAGLSGLGDLALTCSSERSRNYRYRPALGRGDASPAGDTREGIATAAAAAALVAAHNVETPIAEAVAAILEHGSTIDEAVQTLLARPLCPEG